MKLLFLYFALVVSVEARTWPKYKSLKQLYKEKKAYGDDQNFRVDLSEHQDVLNGDYGAVPKYMFQLGDFVLGSRLFNRRANAVDKSAKTYDKLQKAQKWLDENENKEGTKEYKNFETKISKLEKQFKQEREKIDARDTKNIDYMENEERPQFEESGKWKNLRSRVDKFKKTLKDLTDKENDLLHNNKDMDGPKLDAAINKVRDKLDTQMKKLTNEETKLTDAFQKRVNKQLRIEDDPDLIDSEPNARESVESTNSADLHRISSRISDYQHDPGDSFDLDKGGVSNKDVTRVTNDIDAGPGTENVIVKANSGVVKGLEPGKEVDPGDKDTVDKAPDAF